MGDCYCEIFARKLWPDDMEGTAVSHTETKTVRFTETRKRGIFGWFFLLLFWGWQILMAISVFRGLIGTGEHMAQYTTEAERTGAAIGATIGFGMVLTLWAVGTIVFGALAFFTRGKKVIIQETT